MILKFESQGEAAFRADMEGFSERRIRATLATALTRTAIEAKAAADAELLRAIDRPTPYTQRQMRYIGARADRLTAVVGFDIEAVTDIQGNVQRYSSAGRGNTPASKYLLPQVEGGQRSTKRFELALQASGAMPQGWRAVPATGSNSAVRLDAYGNVSRGQIAQIVAQVGTELLRGYNSTTPNPQDKRKSAQAKRRRALGRAGGQYVAVPQRKGRLAPGIYLAEARDFGAKLGLGRSGKLRPVFLFVKSVSYRPRFDFDGAVGRVVEQRLVPNVERAIAEQRARLQAQSTGGVA